MSELRNICNFFTFKEQILCSTSRGCHVGRAWQHDVWLENYINPTVAVITSDGRMIVGTLKGFDQTINLILHESHEPMFSSSQGVEPEVVGLYIVRGDNVAVIGEIDEEMDSALDLGNIPAEPQNSVAH